MTDSCKGEFRELIISGIKYFLVGGIAAGVDISLFLIMSMRIHYLVANIASFVVATLVNYILSILFVFSSGSRYNSKISEVVAVYAASLIGLLVNESVLFLLIDFLGVDKALSKIAAVGVTFFWNFAIRYFYVFHPKNICI